MFDPVNDKTHALALTQIVGEAVETAMDKHVETTHAPEQKAFSRVKTDVRALNQAKWEARGYSAALASVLAFLKLVP